MAFDFGFACGVAALRRRRERAAVAGSVAAVRPPLTVDAVRDALRCILGDAALDLFVWLADRERFVDGTGAPAAPGWDTGRPRHEIRDARGDRLAVLLSGPAPRAGADVVDAAARAAVPHLERARCHAQLLARVRDLAAARVSDVADRGPHRARSGLDLHDSILRRMAALTAVIHAAGAGADPAVRAVAVPAAAELCRAAGELRDLARDAGVPEQLGLGLALRRLGAVLPFPVRVEVEALPLAPTTAAAAYQVACEGLANVVAHAGAGLAIVTVRRHGPTLQIAVSDDGTGGAKPAVNGGIAVLAEQFAALGGLLHVDSPPGSGTRLTAELPYNA